MNTERFGEGHTLLLLEDDEDLLEALACRLHDDLGFEVITQTKSREAMKVLRSTPRIDWLISDLDQESENSGLNLIRLAKDPGCLPRHGKINAFVMTGRREEKGEAKLHALARREGISGYCYKPCPWADFKQRLQRIQFPKGRLVA